jgi:hypothetical protein
MSLHRRVLLHHSTYKLMSHQIVDELGIFTKAMKSEGQDVTASLVLHRHQLGRDLVGQIKQPVVNP